MTDQPPRPRMKLNPKIDQRVKYLERFRKPREVDPTEEEIRQRTAEIRQGWSLKTKITRWQGRHEHLLANLEAEGYSPDEIDAAIQAHRMELGRSDSEKGSERRERVAPLLGRVPE